MSERLAVSGQVSLRFGVRRMVAATSTSNRTRAICATTPRMRGMALGDQVTQLMFRCANSCQTSDSEIYS